MASSLRVQPSVAWPTDHVAMCPIAAAYGITDMTNVAMAALHVLSAAARCWGNLLARCAFYNEHIPLAVVAADEEDCVDRPSP